MEEPPLVLAYRWAGRITTVAIEMVAPGMVGVAIDSYLGTKVVFALLGFALGSVLAVWHLLQMTKVVKHSVSEQQVEREQPKPPESAPRGPDKKRGNRGL